jgi:sucrose phosphorylase
MGIKNCCQLITYPDSLGGDLKALFHVLTEKFSRAVTGVHILPFYPSSADRGFAPLTYYEVEKQFGSWEDITRIAGSFELICDFMVNHLSRQSEYFQDFIRNKDSSEYADLFIRYKDFWPAGAPRNEDLEKIYTRKPRPPYIEAQFHDGSVEKIWCTFDPEQIDFDIKSNKTRSLFSDFLTFLCDQGAKMVRLDAFAYATKKPGTSCFFIEPDVWVILDFIRSVVAPYEVELLPEVHEHYSYQLKLAERGFWVYDFALPMLTLQALYEGRTGNLKRWFSICPRKQITTLDTHDGIGVVDVGDLMTGEEIERTKNNLFEHGANLKRRYNTAQYNNLDVYQINCTYYSALGNNDRRYLLARAIQLFAPGIPQVYYVGLLAGENDVELVEKTKVGRNINRHSYTLEEIETELDREVVKDLFTLMSFRNRYPAFDGSISIHDTPDNILRVSWKKEKWFTELEADVADGTFSITYWDENSGGLFELDTLL